MPLTLITKRDRIKSVAIKWESQYRGMLGNKRFRKDDTYASVLNRLEQLNLDTCTEEEVIDIIGNNSWTRLLCDNCYAEVDRIVQVGDRPAYESSTANLCQKCAANAVELFLEDNYNEHS